MSQTELTRQPIRIEVRRLLLDRLLSGELEPGARITESKLALELGVSRTPLREALLRLEFEGFLRSASGKGFSVAPLSSEAAANLYSLVGLLEPLAVETAGLPNEATLRKLDDIEDARVQAKLNHNLEEAVALANRWHNVLVQGCPNRELLDILAVLKRRLYRYEYSLVDEVSRVGQTHDHHQQILRAFRHKDLPLAIERLKEHWRLGADTRSRLLRSQEKGGEERVPGGKDKWTSLM